jgi:ABC-2 type transport system ATP-binding protein
MVNALEVSRVTHRYPGRKGQPERTVLSDLSLTVAAGEIFGLLGPNGGGKTTLFRLLSTALLPSAGELRIFGADPVTDSARVRSHIGVVFQSPSLDPHLSVLENLRHQGHLYGLNGPDLAKRCDEAMERLSLTSRAREMVKTLSGGLKRRVEIAKGLLHRPPVLLLDEPSTGLDPAARREMWSFLLDLKKQNITLLLTTHLTEEGDLCDRVGILDQGRLVALGTPADLKHQIGGDVVTIKAEDPASLLPLIKDKFRVEPSVINRLLRFETPDGHTFVPSLIEAFPGKIQSVSVGKPTLEDVFVHQTGRAMTEAETS